ncbi:MAG: DNA-binding domain-containing protein, partial [Rubrivivax sp.]|nr:DNA-binding domain-containing protein [Rubrivivax sp.]
MSAGFQADWAAALLTPDLACPPGLRAWNGSDPGQRLAVYRNNVVGSLVGALADTFPVVRQLVGDEFFGAMAALFVRQAPPRSPVLAHYGGEFPAFVDSFEPARSLAYLGDMARLEFARVVAFHAADVAPATDTAWGLALGSGERITELALGWHPSLSVLRSASAVVSLWAAHQGQDDDLAAVDPALAENALVLRDGLDVLVRPLTTGAAEFLIASGRGVCLGQAAALAAQADPDFDLAATLTLARSHGALSSIELPRR